MILVFWEKHAILLLIEEAVLVLVYDAVADTLQVMHCQLIGAFAAALRLMACGCMWQWQIRCR